MLPDVAGSSALTSRTRVRLAGAGVADDAVDVAGLDVEADAVDGDDRVAALLGRRVRLRDVAEATSAMLNLLRTEQSCGTRIGRRDRSGRHRPAAYWLEPSGDQPLAASVSDSTLASDSTRSATGRLQRDRGAAGGLEQRRLHLLVGLEDLDELQVRLVVLVLGARREDVDVGQRVRVARVVLRDRVLEAEAGVLDEVVVDDRRGDVGQRGRGERRPRGR